MRETVRQEQIVYRLKEGRIYFTKCTYRLAKVTLLG
jgi:hypothetical protein